jgi:hypothetical protein
VTKLAQVGASDSTTHGYEYTRAGLDQHPFVHGNVNLAERFGCVQQEARGKCRDAIASMRKQAEGAVPRLRDDAQHIADIDEDLEGQKDL